MHIKTLTTIIVQSILNPSTTSNPTFPYKNHTGGIQL